MDSKLLIYFEIFPPVCAIRFSKHELVDMLKIYFIQPTNQKTLQWVKINSISENRQLSHLLQIEIKLCLKRDFAVTKVKLQIIIFENIPTSLVIFFWQFLLPQISASAIANFQSANKKFFIWK